MIASARLKHNCFDFILILRYNGGVEQFKDLGSGYFKNLDERRHQSHVYRSFQLVGLELAEILHDEAHKSLYIKIAKDHTDYQRLLGLAKRIAEQDSVRNKGAYFMKLFFDEEYGKKNTDTRS